MRSLDPHRSKMRHLYGVPTICEVGESMTHYVLDWPHINITEVGRILEHTRHRDIKNTFHS